MAQRKRSPTEMRWLFALKLLNTVVTGYVLCELLSFEEMRFSTFWNMYAILFTYSFGSLVLHWGSIVPCIILGMIFAGLFKPVIRSGTAEAQAIEDAMYYTLFPVAGLIIGIIDELMLLTRIRPQPNESTKPVPEKLS